MSYPRRSGTIAGPRARVGAIAAITGLLAVLWPAAAAEAGSTSLRATGHAVTATPAVLRGDTLYFRGHATAPAAGQAATAVRIVGERTGTLVFGDWNGDGIATPGFFHRGRWRLHDQPDAGDKPRTVNYGRAGDIPIAGDWNANGRTTIGIIRDREWHLKDSLSGGSADRTFIYGRLTRGDLPVVGNWNGKAGDGIGIIRDGDWHLRQRPSGGAGQIVFRYGRVTRGDIPIVGDWNGDGKTNIGVVRDATWHLKDRLSGGAADRSFKFGKASDKPIAWPGASPSAGCPTTAWSPATAAGAVAAEVVAPRIDDVDVDDADLAATLTNTHRYLLGTQHPARWQPAPQLDGYYDMLGVTELNNEHTLRPPAMAAASLAIALRTGGYDADAVGQSEEFATEHARELVRSIACEHKSVTMGGWGDHWQSAYWAQFAGLAGWLLWDELDAHERFYVVRMLEYEANRQVTAPARYWRNRAGTGPRNTPGEEVGWDTTAATLAAAMMPGHRNRAAWQHAAVRLGMASAAMPHDLNSTTTVNGRQVRHWVDGYNIDQHGFLYNHDRINPDYSTAMHVLWSAGLFYTLADEPTPRAMLHNGEHIYGALSSHQFDGGTVYIPDSWDIYYPEGSSWSTIHQSQYVNFDAMADAFGLDGTATGSAAEWRRLHTAGQLALQGRLADGRTYTGRSEHRYIGREELAAHHLAYAWLTGHVQAGGRFAIDDRDFSRHVALR